MAFSSGFLTSAKLAAGVAVLAFTLATPADARGGFGGGHGGFGGGGFHGGGFGGGGFHGGGGWGGRPGGWAGRPGGWGRPGWNGGWNGGWGGGWGGGGWGWGVPVVGWGVAAPFVYDDYYYGEPAYVPQGYPAVRAYPVRAYPVAGQCFFRRVRVHTSVGWRWRRIKYCYR
jgi:hypothetical protein